MFRKCLLILIATLQFFAVSARAEELTAEKRADIEKLFALTNSAALSRQMAGAYVENFLKTLRALNPKLTQANTDLLTSEVMAAIDESLPALYQEIVPLYHKHFTADEVRGMLAFYASPLGQKTIDVMPMLVSESMAVGQRWGASLAPRLMQRVSAKLQQQGLKI